MIKIDINMDVGEGLNNEEQLFPYISSCSIACGGHAGDYNSIKRIMLLAHDNSVKIGAHPSFPDRKNFGRKPMDISSEDLYESLVRQLELFKSVALELQVAINHVKPHGALYNLVSKSPEIAEIVLNAIRKTLDVPVYAPYQSEMTKEAKRTNTSVVYEAFADRNYNDDLSLVSRSQPNALITNSEQMLEHVLEIIQFSRVRTATGTIKQIKAETICIHSDSANSEHLVRELYDSLQGLQIQIS